MASIGTRAVWARDKIDQALREDVEAGTISYNDFERTKTFASDAIRYQYYATFAGVAAVTGTVLYRHWYRRQPFNLRSVIFLPLIYTMGSAPCWFAQASAFRRYQHELEDPKATMKALLKTRGIVVLTSGEDPNHGQPQQAGVERFQEPEGNERSLSDNAVGTRWEEIRRGTDTAKPSTWDRIRQSHERHPGRVQPQSGETPPFTEDQEHPLTPKNIEPAGFDALLEAERKMSES